MTPAELLKTVAVALVAVGVAYGATPLAGRLAGVLKMVDQPSARKIHATAIPYLGGLGILAGWCVVLLTSQGVAQSTVLIIGMLVLGVTGFVDDRVDMNPHVRLGIQIGVALLAFAGGIRISPLDNVSSLHGLAFDLPLTVLWLVGMTNAFNFMDNMDGLAAGVGGIAALALGAVGALFGQQLVSVLGFGLAGACLGFLKHNFHPARIFMGDTGSLPLGFGLAVLAAKVEFPGVSPLVAFAIPVVILGLFVIDTTIMALGRVIRGEPIIGARLDHLSHRMLKRAQPVPEVAVRLYMIAGCLGLLGVVASQVPTAIALPIVGAVGLLSAWATTAITRWPVFSEFERTSRSVGEGSTAEAATAA